MYFVGIDISKFKHDCAIVDEIGGRLPMTMRVFPFSSSYWLALREKSG